MEFIDLSFQQRRIREKIENNIRQVLDHGQYIMGPDIRELENKLAEYIGSKYAIGCASGTDALLLGLMAHAVLPGEAVFTPPFTFIATAEVISLLGAIPVFVDVDPRTFNMDPEQLEVAVQALKARNFKSYPLPGPNLIQSATPRGIVGVDLFGLPADYEKINKIAERHSLFVIEDAAQSFGGEFFGRKACSLAEVGCTSFFPAKPLGCYGDGGMVFTVNEKLAGIMDSLRVHGKGADKYDNVRIGINGRLDTLQAAILLAKFEVFSDEIERRQIVAGRYTELLGNGHGVTPPNVPEGMKSAWAQYSVLLKSEAQRKSCQEKMKKAGIPTAIYYPKPLHLQTAFASLGYKEGDFPVSEDLSRRILSLPMHPYLTPEDQQRVVRFLSGD